MHQTAYDESTLRIASLSLDDVSRLCRESPEMILNRLPESAIIERAKDLILRYESWRQPMLLALADICERLNAFGPEGMLKFGSPQRLPTPRDHGFDCWALERAILLLQAMGESDPAICDTTGAAESAVTKVLSLIYSQQIKGLPFSGPQTCRAEDDHAKQFSGNLAGGA